MLKYLYATNILGDTLVKIIVEGSKAVLEFTSPEDLSKFIEFLNSLGVTRNIVKKETKIEYDEKFWDYLVKDRQLDEKTAKSYMNYLRKLDGEVINYDLYLRILDNKWKVKLVRIYLDFLEKNNKIFLEERDRLKSIFKVKKKERDDDEYYINVYDLVDKYSMVSEESLYKLLLEILLYSGARLTEVVKMVREWDDGRLVCFEEFCRYKLKWRRGRKRCNWIYFPRRLLTRIARYAGRIGKYENLRKNIYDYYGIREKEFRKLHYRLCRRVLDKEICCFYQSRGLDVSDRDYDELRTRSDENYPKLVRTINKFIDRIREELYVGRPVEEGEIIEIRVGKLYLQKKISKK